jgi:hypothetical protein
MAMAKRPKSDRGASAVAQNLSAPAAERYDAQAEVTKSVLGRQLVPASELLPVIDYIQNGMADDAFNKSLAKGNVIPFPPKYRGEKGMQSVQLDEFNLTAQGYYWDRPGLLDFDSLRNTVAATPILNAIILTRIRQVTRFCRPQMSQSDTGFIISHVDKTLEMNDEQQQSVKLLQGFISNCGWEANPRRRKRLRRDSFAQFMAKSVRDSLTLDAAPIETEFKRDRSLGLDGFYAVDGGSIRLCTEDGYQGDDEIFALQVIQGRIRTAYTYDDLIYEVRNPRTDVLACGYGLSEVELLIKVVTYLLNTMTFNGSFFDKNSIPRGILHLAGNYSNEDIAAFKRYWMAMTKGAANAFNLPVMVSKDMESKAEFAEVGGQMNEMAFGKWLSFLTSVSCAIFGISPEEVSMESYKSGNTSGMAGNDTEEKITSSNDKGLRPLLAYYESLFSDFVIQEFSQQYMFRFVGLDGDDAKSRFEMRKIALTYNEARAETGYDPVPGDLGDAPINPALLSAWQAERQIAQQAKQADGDQPDFGEPTDGVGGDDGFGEPPQPGDEDYDGEDNQDDDAPGGAAAPGSPADTGADAPEDVEKAFGLRPIFRVEA